MSQTSLTQSVEYEGYWVGIPPLRHTQLTEKTEKHYTLELIYRMLFILTNKCDTFGTKQAETLNIAAGCVHLDTFVLHMRVFYGVPFYLRSKKTLNSNLFTYFMTFELSRVPFG